MNTFRRWLTERWLKSRGWEMCGYPFPRGHSGFQYMAYWHPDIPHSTGGIEWAVKLEKKRANQIGASHA